MQVSGGCSRKDFRKRTPPEFSQNGERKRRLLVRFVFHNVKLQEPLDDVNGGQVYPGMVC